MSQAVAATTKQPAPRVSSAVEPALMYGDLSQLTEQQRGDYYSKVCESLGLNPLTQPLQYIWLPDPTDRTKKKLTAYIRKDATEQLRANRCVSLTIVAREVINDCYIVTARATMPSGRTDESIGAVPLTGFNFKEKKNYRLSGDALANAYMKAECVPLDYEILTREGFKHALELENGEPVASMDPQTHEIYWTPLEEVSIYAEQRVTTFGNSGVEFEITPGHKWVIETNNGVRDLRPFDELKAGNYLVLAGVNRDSDSILTPQEAAALGWIVTDGTVRSYKGELYRASICQGKRENFEHIEWALAGIGEVTRGVTDNRDKQWLDQHWWYLSKAQTQELFRNAGYSSTDDLARIVCNLSQAARVAMLEAMMRADGDKRNIFGKGDKSTMEAFQILCALTGHLTSRMRIREFDRGTQPFYVQRKFSHKRVAFQNLEELDSRETTVWCPTTKYGTWICRTTQGQVMVTGNTKAKRRVTLSICGLGWLDESEIESIKGAQVVPLNEQPVAKIEEQSQPRKEQSTLDFDPENPGAYRVQTHGAQNQGVALNEIDPDKMRALLASPTHKAKLHPEDVMAMGVYLGNQLERIVSDEPELLDPDFKEVE